MQKGLTQVAYAAVVFSGFLNGFAEAATPSFQTTPSNLLGQPSDNLSIAPLVIGDFNGDGRDDILVQEWPGGDAYYYQVFLGRGDGTFTAMSPQLFFTFAPNAYGNAVISQPGDFNGDGKLDLLELVNDGAPGSVTSSVVLLAGNGNGTFTPSALFNVETNSMNATQSITVADLNQDGIPDFLIQITQCCGDQPTLITTFLGNGNGTFTPGPSFASDYYSSTVAVTDMNMDGKVDLVFATVNAVYYAPGNGTGSFDVANQVLMGSIPNGYFSPNVQIPDLNGDGAPDLALTYSSGDPSSGLTFLNIPEQKAFVPGPTFSFPGYVEFSAVGDFNGDGRPDIAYCSLVSGKSNAPLLTIFANEGNGKLQPLTSYAACGGLTSGDWNQDGHEDLAAFFGNDLVVGLGNGAGQLTFGQSAVIGGGHAIKVFPADLNHDGITDILATIDHENLSGYITHEVMMRLGNGDGTFQPASTVLVGKVPIAATAADLNNDGIADLIVTDSTTNAATAGLVWVVLGQAGGTWATPVSYPAAGIAHFVLTSDLNGDGIPDVVASSNTSAVAGQSATYGVNVLLGKANGTLEPARMKTLKNFVSAMVVGDFHGNGHPDLVIASEPGNAVLLLPGNGDGTFGIQALVSSAISPAAIITADWNSDGKLDLAVGYAGGVQIFFGNGDGTFQPAVNYPMPTPVISLAAADFNLDGTPDLVAVLNSRWSSFVVLTGGGAGTFSVGTPQFANGYAVAAWPANIYGSGFPDLLFAESASDEYISTDWIGLSRNNTR